MLHAVFLLLFMLVAAPLASYIPLAALAAVLAVVAWNMAEKHEFATLLRASRGDAVVLLVTFLLVVFRDLTEGILVGFGIGALLFLHRMAQAVEVERPMVEQEADSRYGERQRAHALRCGAATDPDVIVYRISGAFFFGAAASVAAALDRIGAPEGLRHRLLGRADASLHRRRDDRRLCAQGAAARRGRLHRGRAPAIRRVLLAHGVQPPCVRYGPTLADAVAAARARTGDAGGDTKQPV